jgi:DNA replication protein DnaC
VTEDCYKQLTSFRIRGFADKAKEIADDSTYDKLTFLEKLELCSEAETERRTDNKVIRLNKQAKFALPTACVEDVEYLPERSLKRESVARLASCRFMDEGQNVIIVSATGSGKSYLCQAIGNAACRLGRSVRYIRHADLCRELNLARQSGTFYKVMDRFVGTNLLVLDDLFLTDCSMQNITDLFEIIEARMVCGSLLLSSQLPPEQWHLRIDTKIIADALLDRVIHNAHLIEIDGPNMREYYAKKSQK